MPSGGRRLPAAAALQLFRVPARERAGSRSLCTPARLASDLRASDYGGSFQELLDLQNSSKK